MDIFEDCRRRTAATLGCLVRDGMLPADIDLGRFAAVPPALDAAWDIVVDAALVYGGAAAAGHGRQDVAEAIARDLAAAPFSARVTVAGSGFVNVALRPTVFLDAVAAVLRGPLAEIGVVDGSASTAEFSRLSLEDARAVVVGEQRAALFAAAGRTPSADAAGGEFRGRIGAVRVRQGGAAVARDGLAGLAAEGFRFAVASQRPEATLHLDLSALTDRSHRNPAFWVPYAHARLRGLLRHASSVLPDADLSPAALADADLSGLTDPGEAALARLVARYAHVVAAGASVPSLQRLVAYLGELATSVHAQWNRSKDQPQLRFVNEEERALTKARLGLATASTLVLKSGLGILGVTAHDEMR